MGTEGLRAHCGGLVCLLDGCHRLLVCTGRVGDVFQQLLCVAPLLAQLLSLELGIAAVVASLFGRLQHPRAQCYAGRKQRRAGQQAHERSWDGEHAVTPCLQGL